MGSTRNIHDTPFLNTKHAFFFTPFFLFFPLTIIEWKNLDPRLRKSESFSVFKSHLFKFLYIYFTLGHCLSHQHSLVFAFLFPSFFSIKMYVYSILYCCLYSWLYYFIRVCSIINLPILYWF